MATIDLSNEISAFLAQRPRLLKQFGPSWVVFVGQSARGAFATYQEAIAAAIRDYGSDEFLIRYTEEQAPYIPLVVVTER